MDVAKGAVVAVRYPVEPQWTDWVLPEGTVPESVVHDTVAKRLQALLEGWAERHGGVQVARNLAVRWVKHAPQVGIDPDVCLLIPPPPEGDQLDSMRLWEPGHAFPPLCIEVVSRNHPHKDYSRIHERYAVMGALELVVFDPLRVGPRSLGGPVALQLWKRDDTGAFARVAFGDEPVYSQVLDAWFVAEGQRLDIADDAAGDRRWLTEAETARADAERARAAAEREHAARVELERKYEQLLRESKR